MMNLKDEQKSSGTKENPVKNASFLSRITYWWLRKIFIKGYRQPITEDDIYDCLPEHKTEDLHKKISQLWKEEQLRKKPRMLRVFFRAFGRTTVFWGVLFACVEALDRLALSLFLGYLVSYFAPGQTDITRHEAYLYGLGLVVCSLVPALTFHPFILYIYQIALKFRVSCCCLIYEKTLALTKSATIDGLSGRVINLMSNDVGKFDVALPLFHSLWKGPIELFLLGYFIYREIGLAGILGMVFMLSFIPLQAWVGKTAASYRLKATKHTDVRVKFMNEIVQGIQVIKMYTWENSFAKMIAKIRSDEVKAIKGGAYVRATLLSFFMVSRVAIFLSLTSYIYIGNVITARKVFVVTSYFNFLNESMVQLWPLAITFASEAYISTKRITDFLMIRENKPAILEEQELVNGQKIQKNHQKIIETIELNEKQEANRRVQNVNATKKRILMWNATADWTSVKVKANPGIRSVNVEINGLAAVVGPVGSGKTTLLHVMLGELELDSGQVHIDGTISYAAQDPWLFEGSIRQNIVFVEPFDEARYRQVVKVCALKKDFELLPYGDQTVVGERGISMSGGQKARVSLARAIYKKADIYLLDDPLSAVDTHVGQHIFDQCVREFLSDKVCVLVTHQLQYLKNVKHIILMNDARIEAQGTYEDLIEKKNNILLTLQDVEEHEKPTEEKNVPFVRELSVLGEDEPEEIKENQEIGSVSFRVYKKYFNAVNSNILIVSVMLLFVLAQCVCSGVDIFVAQWVNWEETFGAKTTFIETFAIQIGNLLSQPPIPLETYFQNIENTSKNRTTTTFYVTRETIRQGSIIIYAIIMATLTYLTVQSIFAFFYLCLRISKNLHDKMFRGITRAHMFFFNTNPSGRILNRFSKDTGNIDTVLPPVLLECINFVLRSSAVMIVVSIVNYWLLIPTCVLVIIMSFLRKVYVKTSRSIKRLESLSRSPLFSHANATLSGLSTIRALNASENWIKQFAKLQDFNSSVYYLALTTGRVFAVWLDTLCVVYIATVVITFLFVVVSGTLSGGSIGLAISQAITLVGLCQWGMTQTAELENHMVSVERVQEYVSLESEPPMESKPEYAPNEDWPNEGKIKFDNLSLKYSNDSDYVLKQLTFEIRPQSKIGIVGRTGAGKSSIIQALFRLAPIEGLIEIDDVNIQNLGLQDLRSKISIIPQNPVLFSGTMRSNLDPFDEKTDSEIWDALEQVELKKDIQSMHGGLECIVSDGGCNFSMGQKQLVCLARALLRNNKILILDEATANVDPETDAFIQKTIRNKFSHCTVLTIAHRLHTVMDSDKLLVMDAGRVVEFDIPYLLLQKSHGILKGLVEKTGTMTSGMLKSIAEQNYRMKSRLDEVANTRL